MSDLCVSLIIINFKFNPDEENHIDAAACRHPSVTRMHGGESPSGDARRGDSGLFTQDYKLVRKFG